MRGRGFAEYANASSLVGLLTRCNKATLYELQTIYSYEDALTMYENQLVDHYNEWVALEDAKQKRR